MNKFNRFIKEEDIAYILADNYPSLWEKHLHSCTCTTCNTSEKSTIVDYIAQITAYGHIKAEGKCAKCGEPIRLILFDMEMQDRYPIAMEVAERIQKREFDAWEYTTFPEDTVFHLEIKLMYSRPVISRKVVVPAHFNFHELHYVIQFAMGWQHCHLHQFKIEDGLFLQIPLDNDMDEIVIEDTRKHQLQEFFQEVGDSLVYEYDFGDSWNHSITLKKIAKAKKGQTYPALVDGKGACPPENCGGVHGYTMMINALHYPNSDYYEYAQSLFKRHFDPKFFPLHATNERFFVNFSRVMKAWEKKAGYPKMK